MVQKLVYVLAISVGLACVAAVPRFSPNGLEDDQTPPKVELTQEEEANLTKCLNSHRLDQIEKERDMKKTTSILSECLSEIPAFKPIALVFNVLSYYLDKNETKKDFCGITEENASPDVKELFKKLEHAIKQTNADFCQLTTEEFLPTLCKLRSHCKTQNQEPELIFAVYYATHQLTAHHPEPFSCKDSNGKEVIGPIINPKAYDSDFNLKKNKILTKPLPCNVGKSQSTTKKPSTQSSVTKMSIDVVKPVVNHIAKALRF